MAAQGQDALMILEQTAVLYKGRFTLVYWMHQRGFSGRIYTVFHPHPGEKRRR